MKIAIASGKGGTGKTSVATNLAALMAGYEDTVLVDLDVEEPDTSLFISPDKPLKQRMFRMVPQWDATQCSLCGKCQEVCNFNAIINILDEIIVSDQLCHGCYACSVLCPDGALTMKEKGMGDMTSGSVDGLNYIEGRLDVGEEQAVPLIAQSLEYINKTYSSDAIVIIDAPPGTSCPVMEIGADADLIILVTEPSPFGLNDLKLSVETVQLLNRDFAVVINRDGPGNAGTEEYCAARNIPIIAKIPFSRKAAELYSSGKLLYKEIPEVRTAMEKISAYILQFQYKMTK